MTSVMPARPTVPRSEDDPLEPVERHLSRGDWKDALETLLPVLDARAAKGDRALGLAAQLLRAKDSESATPETMAEALDHLVALVERQETQIRALRAIVEGKL